MKQGWERKKLEDLAANIPYPIGDGDHGQIKPKDYSDSGVPYIRVGDMGWGEFVPNQLVHIPNNVHESNLKSELRPGDILVAKTGATIGKCCIVPDHIRRANTTSSVGKITVNQEKVLPKWVLLWFQTQEFLRFIWSISHRAAQPGFNNRDIKLFEIPVPPLSEQNRIIAILDQCFEAIDNAKANVERNLQNAKRLFQSQLTQVFTQKDDDWVEKKLEDVCSVFARGKSRHRPRNAPLLYGGEYPFIQTGDISQADQTIMSYSQTYNEAGLAQSKLWPKGTVCIAIVGATIGESGILGFDACFPDSVIGMTVDEEKADTFYVEYLLRHSKAEIKMQGEGSARDNINLGTFQNLMFPFPPLDSQRRFVSRLNALGSETQRLESIYQQKLDSLIELKHSILQKAFAGELTSVPEKVAV